MMVAATTEPVEQVGRPDGDGGTGLPPVNEVERYVIQYPSSLSDSDMLDVAQTDAGCSMKARKFPRTCPGSRIGTSHHRLAASAQSAARQPRRPTSPQVRTRMITS